MGNQVAKKVPNPDMIILKEILDAFYRNKTNVPAKFYELLEKIQNSE